MHSQSDTAHNHCGIYVDAVAIIDIAQMHSCTALPVTVQQHCTDLLTQQTYSMLPQSQRSAHMFIVHTNAFARIGDVQLHQTSAQRYALHTCYTASCSHCIASTEPVAQPTISNTPCGACGQIAAPSYTGRTLHDYPYLSTSSCTSAVIAAPDAPLASICKLNHQQKHIYR
jgi:hypothetical protein